MIEAIEIAGSLGLLLASAVANSVLLGAAITAVVWLGFRVLPGISPSARHAILWATLAGVVAIGFTGLPRLPSASTSAYDRPVYDRGSLGAGDVSGGRTAGSSRSTASVRNAEGQPLPDGPWTWIAAAGLVLWVGVSSIRLSRVLRGCLLVRDLKRKCRPVSDSCYRRLKSRLRRGDRWVRLCQSDAIQTPVATGLLNPAIILPDSMVEELAGEELDDVVMHELAHLRRLDDWGSLAQRLVQAVFFWHPVVTFVCRQLELERELACDEAVVGTTGERRRYAACLTRLASMMHPVGGPGLAFGSSGSRPQIVERVGRLMHRKEQRLPAVGRMSAAIVLVLGLAVFSGCARLGPLFDLPQGPSGLARLAGWQQTIVKLVWGNPYGDSIGPADRVTVLAGKAEWAALERDVKDLFERTVATPQPEKLFTVGYGGSGEEKHTNKWRNLVILSTEDVNGPTRVLADQALADGAATPDGKLAVVRRDVWARGQTVVVVTAPDRSGLREALLTEADRIFSAVETGLGSRLSADLYADWEQQKLAERLSADYGWRVRVPFRFTLLDEHADSGFVVLTRLKPNVSQWLFVYQEDGIPPDALTEDYCIDKRDEVTRRFFEGDEVVPSDLTVSQCEFAGKLAVRVDGLWQNRSTWKGGPFRSYAFVDAASGRFYLVDIGVFAPNREKLVWLRQMQEVVSSFELMRDSESWRATQL